MSVLLRRLPVVLLITALALVGTFIGLLVGPRTYSATATLRIPVASGAGTVGQDDLDYVDRLTNTYKRIGESASLRAQVERQLGSDDIELSVQPIANTELTELTATADNPELAQAAANAGAQALVQTVRAGAEGSQRATRAGVAARLRELEGGLSDLRAEAESAGDPGRRAVLEQRIRVQEIRYEALSQQAAELDATGTASRTLSLAEPATSSQASSGIGPKVGIGLILGVIAGVGVALLLERRSPQLDTLEEIEAAMGAPILATIPVGPGSGPVIYNGGNAQQEAFGQLRARLLSGPMGDTPRTLLVTSAGDGDGKTVVAANLAAALARARRRVLLVDGDLRNPGLHRLFEVHNGRGLMDVLQHPDDTPWMRMAITPTQVGDLSLLPSGEPLGGTTETLAAPTLKRLVERVKLDYDYVVIDSSDLLTTSDTVSMASQVDTVIFVIGKTPIADGIVREARRRLRGVGADNVGVVVNRWRREAALIEEPRSPVAVNGVEAH